MDVGPLAIPLPALLALTDTRAAVAVGPRFVLYARACLVPLGAGGFRLALVMFAHGSGFPCTDAASHQTWAVGFPNVDPIHEEGEHTHIAPVEIPLKLAARKPGEQARADVPASLKCESVSIRDAIPMMGSLAIDGLHQQQFEIIRGSQRVWHPALRHRLFPQHRAP